MGLMRVVRGTGEGSWFGHGRILGVHNPFGSDLAKARDPFIGIKTLVRLSYSNDVSVQRAVAENLSLRIGGTRSTEEHMSFSLPFSARVKLEALVLAKDISEDNLSAREYIKSLNISDLDYFVQHSNAPVNTVAYFLVNHSSCQARSAIIELPKISRQILIALAKQEWFSLYSYGFSGDIKLFQRLRESLTPLECAELAASPSVYIQDAIVSDERTPREAIFQIVLSPKTEEIAIKAFNRIRDSLIEEELALIAKEHWYRYGWLGLKEAVINHPRTSRQTMLEMASRDRGSFLLIKDGLSAAELGQIFRNPWCVTADVKREIFHHPDTLRELREIIRQDLGNDLWESDSSSNSSSSEDSSSPSNPTEDGEVLLSPGGDHHRRR